MTPKFRGWAKDSFSDLSSKLVSGGNLMRWVQVCNCPTSKMYPGPLWSPNFGGVPKMAKIDFSILQLKYGLRGQFYVQISNLASPKLSNLQFTQTTGWIHTVVRPQNPYFLHNVFTWITSKHYCTCCYCFRLAHGPFLDSSLCLWHIFRALWFDRSTTKYTLLLAWSSRIMSQVRYPRNVITTKFGLFS